MALCGISRAQSPLTQRAASAAEGDAKSSLQPRRPISILGGTSSAELFSEDVGTVLGISAIGKSQLDAIDLPYSAVLRRTAVGRHSPRKARNERNRNTELKSHEALDAISL